MKQFLCANCGYELATPGGELTRCPECGHLAVQAEQRRRLRRATLAGSLLSLLPPLATNILFISTYASEFGWRVLKAMGTDEITPLLVLSIVTGIASPIGGVLHYRARLPAGFPGMPVAIFFASLALNTVSFIAFFFAMWICFGPNC